MPTGQREDATRALAERLTREIVPAVAYGRECTSAFFSPRLGLPVVPPIRFRCRSRGTVHRERHRAHRLTWNGHLLVLRRAAGA